MTNEVPSLVAAVSAILTFLAVIINILNTNWKEARNRRWAQEDAIKLAEKAERDKEELAKTTRHTVRGTEQSMNLQFQAQRDLLQELIQDGEKRLKLILAKIEEGTQVATAKIDENTQISKDAFKEANGVNEKLTKLGLEIKGTKTTN